MVADYSPAGSQGPVPKAPHADPQSRARILFGAELVQNAYLRNSIEGLGIPCDPTLGRTQEWVRRADLDVERVLASLREFGGYCDCEVNVTPDKFGWPEV